MSEAKRVDAMGNCEKCGKAFMEDCCEYDEASGSYLCTGCLPKASNAKHTHGMVKVNCAQHRSGWTLDNEDGTVEIAFCANRDDAYRLAAACNSHAGLLEACRAALEAIGDTLLPEKCAIELRQIEAQLTAAIAKAEGNHVWVTPGQHRAMHKEEKGHNRQA